MADLSHIARTPNPTRGRRIQQLWLAISLPVGIALLALWTNNYLLIGIPLIIFITWQRAGAMFRTGVDAEDVMLAVLSRLPDEYTVYNDLFLPMETGRGKTMLHVNYLVKGPQGITVVETRHEPGRFEGGVDDRLWVRVITDLDGTIERLETRNSTKLIKQQMWALRQYLHRYKSSSWVDGMLCFTNTNSQIAVEGDNGIPLVSHDDVLEQLVGMIVRRPKTQRMRHANRVDQALADLSTNRPVPAVKAAEVEALSEYATH
ncbi:MAG: nuclease-related domain-containing protein [Gammaproteobacteria bacterium]